MAYQALLSILVTPLLLALLPPEPCLSPVPVQWLHPPRLPSPPEHLLHLLSFGIQACKEDTKSDPAGSNTTLYHTFS